MELPDIKIIDEYNKKIREVSKEVTFPLTKDQKQRIADMIKYLKMSQDEK